MPNVNPDYLIGEGQWGAIKVIFVGCGVFYTFLIVYKEQVLILRSEENKFFCEFRTHPIL